MDAIGHQPKTDLDAEAKAHGVVFVLFIAMDDGLEAFPNESWRLARVGGLTAVAEKCVDAGEEAELLDRDGYYLGRVCCDGSVEWGV